MTYLDVYIGDLNDPDFKWEGSKESSNCPKRISPFFPPNTPKSVWDAVVDLTKSDKFEGKQTDWGCFVIKMTKKQIKDFIAEFYGKNKKFDLKHLQKQMNELLNFIEGLDDKKQYALVASEF